MEEIKAYKSESGNIYERKEDAERDDFYCRFKVSYEEDTLSGNYAGSRVDFGDLVNWLLDNRAMVKTLYDYY